MLSLSSPENQDLLGQNDVIGISFVLDTLIFRIIFGMREKGGNAYTRFASQDWDRASRPRLR